MNFAPQAQVITGRALALVLVFTFFSAGFSSQRPFVASWSSEIAGGHGARRNRTNSFIRFRRLVVEERGRNPRSFPHRV